MMYDTKEITWAAQLACIFEVCAKKPGNVHVEGAFSDSNPFDFFAGAVAMGTSFQRLDELSVGELVLCCIKDKSKLTSTNVNLGILLLLAPLCKAARSCEADGSFDAIRSSLEGVLDNLTEGDADCVYEAIRLSGAGGMGKIERYDVSQAHAGIPLKQAMAEAAHRDSIAREYVTNFSVTFEISLPAIWEALNKGLPLRDAIVQAFLTILSEVADTLIARKLGITEAAKVSKRAAEVLKTGGLYSATGKAAMRKFDLYLRRIGNKRNPGTTADLTVSGLFLYLLDCIHKGTLPSLIKRW